MTLNKNTDKITGEEMYYTTHESGLKIYIMPRKGYSSNYAIFGTKYGSVHSDFIVPGETEITHVPDGIAHYLEHKMFDQPDGSNVFDKFSRLGADANAFTSFNLTAYLFSATDNFFESLGVLLDYVQSPYFTKESVEKEQGIIGQEIKMYDDNGPWKVFFNLLGCLYHESPVKKEIAGTVESISHITDEYLYKCYNTFYNLSNMTIFVTGDFDPYEAYDVIVKGIKNNEPFTEEIKKIFPKEPDSVYKPYTEQALDVSMPLFMMGFKDTDNGYGGDRLLKKYLEVQILQKMLFGKGTPIYRKLYDMGLINDSFSLDYTVEKEYGHSTIDGESQDPKKVFEIILDETDKIRNEGLKEDEYERVKKVLWGDYIKTFNDIEEYAHTFLTLHMMGVDIFNYNEIYRSITFDDIKNRFNEHFTRDKAALSVVLPK